MFNHLYSVFIFWFNDCKWIRTTCSPFAKTTVPPIVHPQIFWKILRENLERSSKLMSHFHRSRKI
nr:MAG TPA: hypothetical protein [Caudoviricetes sp.]